MSTEFEDPALEQHLARRGGELGRDLEVPDLNGMIAVAVTPAGSRHRWVWPLLAAVLLLAVPLVTVLAVHHSHPSHPAVATSPDDPSLALLGDELWSDAVLQPDGSTIAVLADVNRTPGNFCLDNGVPVLKPVITESAGAVHIEVKAYKRLPESTPSVPAGTTLACSDVGRSPVPVVVTLTTPLNGRQVTGGTTTVVQDAAGFPAASYLPAGFVARNSVVVSGQGIIGNNLMHREYVGKQDTVLDIVEGGPTYTNPKTIATGTVHGQPAQVTQEGSWNDNVCATWSADDRVWSVCSLEGSSAPLPPSELLKVANGLH